MKLFSISLLFALLGVSTNMQAMQRAELHPFSDADTVVAEHRDEQFPSKVFFHPHHAETIHDANDSDHGEEPQTPLTRRSSGILSPQTEVTSPVTYPYRTAQRDDENSEQEAAITRIAAQEHHHLEPEHTAIHEDIEPAHFTEEEYEHYLQRIKSLDPELYSALMHYQERFFAPAFFKARNTQEATVRLPLPQSPEFPRMILPDNLSDAELERYLESFRALQERHTTHNEPIFDFAPYQYNEHSDEFSDVDYTHYMELIGKINPALQKKLQETESEWYRQKAIFKAYVGEEPGFEWYQNDDHSKWYLVLNLPPLEGKPEEEQVEILRTILAKYPEQNAEHEQHIPRLLEPADIKRILRIIQELAPEVHEAITKADPDGTNHIKTDFHGTGIGIDLAQDGLPLIVVEKHLMNQPDDSLRWYLAHELGHYAQGDLLDFPDLKHKGISFAHEGPQIRSFTTSTGKTIQVTGKLSPEQVLHNRHRQQKEYAADAFAVRQPGVSFEHAKDAQEILSGEDTWEPNTFMREHPLVVRTSRGSNPQLEGDIASLGRIEQITSGTARVEESRTQSKQPAPTDWNAIITTYKKALQTPSG